MKTWQQQGGSAYPVQDGGAGGFVPETGMSLRDYFAGQVIAGLAAKSSTNYPSNYVKFAYTIADLMLEERQKD